MRRVVITCGVVFVGLSLLLGLPCEAGESDWRQIGSKKFKAKDKQESMRIGIEDGYFRWLKFGAEGGKIDLKKVTVHFANGDEKVIDNFLTTKDGGETRAVPIAGLLKKLITRIDFKYEIKDDAKKVKVTAYGRRDDD